MAVAFSKMHGAGNDFIMIHDQNHSLERSPEFIRFLCDRHRGIGGDGVIFLQMEQKNAAIRMDYWNSDGSPADMCGNGLRCAASFAFRKGLSGCRRLMTFLSGNNLLSAEICNDEASAVKIELLVTEPFVRYELETGESVFKGAVGVPHVIMLEKDLDALDVVQKGRWLRNHTLFRPAGANVDFVSWEGEGCPVRIRTYERGVEDETLACGTGCASAAVAGHLFLGFPEKLSILSRGEDIIEVEIIKECNILKGVFLTGPAVAVFEGKLCE